METGWRAIGIFFVHERKSRALFDQQQRRRSEAADLCQRSEYFTGMESQSGNDRVCERPKRRTEALFDEFGRNERAKPGPSGQGILDRSVVGAERPTAGVQLAAALW